MYGPTDDDMEAKWGSNWDRRPHGSNETYGNCECDECNEWHEDHRKWKTAADAEERWEQQRKDDRYERALDKADADMDAARDRE